MLRFLSIGLIVSALIAWLAPYCNPSWRLIYYAGMSWPIILILLVLSTIYHFYKNKRFAWVLFVFLLIGIPYARSVFNISTGDSVKGPILRLMTFNTSHLTKPSSKERDAFLVNLGKFIISKDIHVVCLQEFYMNNKVAEKKLKLLNIEKQFPYYYKPSGLGVCILSRYPILQKADTKIYDYGNGAIYADIETPIGVYRFYSIHLLSNNVTHSTDRLLSGEQEHGKKKEIKNVLKTVSLRSLTRYEQAIALRKHAEASNLPVIFCGDFNETPLSRTYRTMSYGRKDAFIEAGSGLGYTYRGRIPFLRIDYILAHNSLNVNQCAYYNIEGSDHKGVIATLSK